MGPLSITYDVPNGGQIYYTLNGSDPDHSGTLYSGPIAIAASTTFRARLFQPGCIPSPIATHSYSSFSILLISM